MFLAILYLLFKYYVFPFTMSQNLVGNLSAVYLWDWCHPLPWVVLTAVVHPEHPAPKMLASDRLKSPCVSQTLLPHHWSAQMDRVNVFKCICSSFYPENRRPNGLEGNCDDGIVLPTLSGVISWHWGDCLPNAKAFAAGGRRKWRAVVPRRLELNTVPSEKMSPR